MLKSISVWSLKDNEARPAADLFAEARAHGFDGVELAIGLKGPVTPETTEADCQILLQEAEAAGVQLSSLASGLGWQFPMSADDPDVRAKGVEMVAHSLRVASWLNITGVLVVPGMLAALGGDPRVHVPYDVAVERIRAGIAQLVPVAEETGAIVGIENVWNRVFVSPLEMRDFIDSFGSDGVGCYLDVGNMILFGYAEDWIRILGKRVCSVHFKDFQRSVGTLDGFCDLLEGDVNYPEVMEALREIGYDGQCVAEFFDLDGAALDKLSGAMDEIFGY